MHLIFFLGGLLHATLLAVVGFFVLFAASRATGIVKRIGDVLGWWLLLLALLAIVGGAFLGPMVMHRMHPWMGHPDGWGPPPAAAPSTAAPSANTAPANTAPAK